MKIFKYFMGVLVILLLSFPLILCGQDPTPDPAPFVWSWKMLLLIAMGVYDVIARIVPTINDISWLSWIIKLLNFLNEFFNRKRKK
jgi:hypothetical protein